MQFHQVRSNRTPQELMRDNLLVKHYAGSHSYGTSLPTSDVDIRGVFCADPINIRTPWFVVRETEVEEDEDTKLYELTHFLKLCLDCNPNIIETLWVDRNDILSTTPAYEMLRDARYMLLSSKIAFTTSGYAIAQLKRIKGHNKHINNPQPEETPKPYQFLSVVQWFGKEKNLNVDLESFCDGHRLVPYGNDLFGVYPWKFHRLYDYKGNLNTQFDENRADLGAPLMLVKWNKKVYEDAKENHRKYWDWKNNRNEARSELEEKFGYDTKHAMHLVRLMRMGVEALREGEIIVKRPDAQELLDIRRGVMTYEEVVDYAEAMDNEIRGVWYKKTHLRKRPDVKFAANLLMELQDTVWSKCQ